MWVTGVQTCALPIYLNVQKIQIVTDCLNVTKEILGGLMQGAGGMILREIKSRSDEFQEVVFRHERREMEKHIILLDGQLL